MESDEHQRKAFNFSTTNNVKTEEGHDDDDNSRNTLHSWNVYDNEHSDSGVHDQTNTSQEQGNSGVKRELDVSTQSSFKTEDEVGPPPTKVQSLKGTRKVKKRKTNSLLGNTPKSIPSTEDQDEEPSFDDSLVLLDYCKLIFL